MKDFRIVSEGITYCQHVRCQQGTLQSAVKSRTRLRWGTSSGRASLACWPSTRSGSGRRPSTVPTSTPARGPTTTSSSPQAMTSEKLSCTHIPSRSPRFVAIVCLTTRELINSKSIDEFSILLCYDFYSLFVIWIGATV